MTEAIKPPSVRVPSVEFDNGPREGCPGTLSSFFCEALNNGNAPPDLRWRVRPLPTSDDGHTRMPSLCEERPDTGTPSLCEERPAIPAGASRNGVLSEPFPLIGESNVQDEDDVDGSGVEFSENPTWAPTLTSSNLAGCDPAGIAEKRPDTGTPSLGARLGTGMPRLEGSYLVGPDIKA